MYVQVENYLRHFFDIYFNDKQKKSHTRKLFPTDAIISEIEEICFRHTYKI